jgi:hypothetical protein
MEGRGIAFAGPPGIGKSTLAAALMQRGISILSDDVCVIDLVQNEASVSPGLLNFRLCPDAVRELGHDPRSMHAAQGHRGKLLLPNQAPRTVAVTLNRVYVLDRALINEPHSFERLRGLDAVRALVFSVFRPTLVRLMGRQREVYAHSVRALGSIQVYKFNRAWGFDNFQIEVDELLNHLRRVPQPTGAAG